MYLGGLYVGRSGLYFLVGRYLPEVRLEGNLAFQAQKYCCVGNEGKVDGVIISVGRGRPRRSAHCCCIFRMRRGHLAWIFTRRPSD